MAISQSLAASTTAVSRCSSVLGFSGGAGSREVKLLLQVEWGRQRNLARYWEHTKDRLKELRKDPLYVEEERERWRIGSQLTRARHPERELARSREAVHHWLRNPGNRKKQNQKALIWQEQHRTILLSLLDLGWIDP